MAEQPPIVAQIKWKANYVRAVNGVGLTTAYIINALRAYFNDTSIPHYWELDTTTVGGSYDIFTNPAPIDTTTNKHTTLVLKPKAGAPGGSEQRIVFITRGSTGTGGVGWGGISVGYLPDGTFDATNGVLTDNPGTFNNIVLTHPPSTWSGFRNITGQTGSILLLTNEFTVVEYRDDPDKFSDPAQSLFFVPHAENFQDEYDRTGLRVFRQLIAGVQHWARGVLVGRILQPFTRYHELAVGNRGDALWTGKLGEVASVGNRPMMEAGWNTTAYIDHSSINRVAPNCWALSWPGNGFSRTSGFLGSEIYSSSLLEYPEGVPLGLGTGPNIVIRDGARVNTTYNGGVYAFAKYTKQFNWDIVGGSANLRYDTTDPTSKRAWYSWPNGFIVIERSQSRHLLWNKDGPTLLDYLQV
jgi:hypothetical protein